MSINYYYYYERQVICSIVVVVMDYKNGSYDVVYLSSIRIWIDGPFKSVG
jgi:hypothetical protein